MNFKNMGHRPHRHPGRIAVFALLLLCAAAIATWLVMALWNAVLVDAVGAKPLSYWQALGLLLLCRLLFGNWGRRGRGGPPALRDTVAGMSPEQRARFREHWRSRCGSADGEAQREDRARAATPGHSD